MIYSAGYVVTAEGHDLIVKSSSGIIESLVQPTRLKHRFIQEQNKCLLGCIIELITQKYKISQE